MARKVELHPDFWSWSLPERRAWFVKEVMVHYLPRELLPGDLIAGGRFNIMSSCCLNEEEAKEYERMLLGKDGARPACCGSTITALATPAPPAGTWCRITRPSWRSVGRAFMPTLSSATGPCPQRTRRAKRRPIARHAHRRYHGARAGRRIPPAVPGPWQPPSRMRPVNPSWSRWRITSSVCPGSRADSFWEAVQSLWLTHMLVMSDENYPGPGLSFGRIDQYLYPYWEHSLEPGMEREFGKEILKCFWMHCQYRLRCLSSHRRQPGDHRRLRTIAHPVWPG